MFVDLWKFLFFFFWPHHVASGILVSQAGIELTPPLLGTWSLNHWTVREGLVIFLKLQIQ